MKISQPYYYIYLSGICQEISAIDNYFFGIYNRFSKSIKKGS
ncbi:MAG: hypothetical protein J6A78_02170 [Clostridia bacterium]|nr:hypothetical protein [Clostridia bacterium]